MISNLKVQETFLFKFSVFLLCQYSCSHADEKAWSFLINSLPLQLSIWDFPMVLFHLLDSGLWSGRCPRFPYTPDRQWNKHNWKARKTCKDFPIKANLPENRIHWNHKAHSSRFCHTCVFPVPQHGRKPAHKPNCERLGECSSSAYREGS